MPEHPFPRKQRPELEAPSEPRAEAGLAYAELHVKTNFSFLKGASHADELVARAAELGYRALAVTDEASLAGIVPGADREASRRLVGRAREVFSELASLALELHKGPDDAARLEAVRRLARETDVPLVAANDVVLHAPERRRLAAVLACIKEGT